MGLLNRAAAPTPSANPDVPLPATIVITAAVAADGPTLARRGVRLVDLRASRAIAGTCA
jgi:hypothetical protein